MLDVKSNFEFASLGVKLKEAYSTPLVAVIGSAPEIVGLVLVVVE